jgi:hypothetical protein
MTRRLRMLICVLIVCVAAYATAGYWMPDRIELPKRKAAPRTVATSYGNDPRVRTASFVSSSPAPGRIHVRMQFGRFYDRKPGKQWWHVEAMAEMFDRTETVFEHDYDDDAHAIYPPGPGRFETALDVLLPIWVEPGFYRVQIQLSEAVPELDFDSFYVGDQSVILFNQAAGLVVVK